MDILPGVILLLGILLAGTGFALYALRSGRRQPPPRPSKPDQNKKGEPRPQP